MSIIIKGHKVHYGQYFNLLAYIRSELDTTHLKLPTLCLLPVWTRFKLFYLKILNFSSPSFIVVTFANLIQTSAQLIFCRDSKAFLIDTNMYVVCRSSVSGIVFTF